VRQFRLATIVYLCVVSVHAFARDCDSAIKSQTVARNGHRVLTVRNVSKHPILAYAIVVQPVTDRDTQRQVFSGQFTDGSSWKPYVSMNFDLSPTTTESFRISVDYLRRSDGWSCGDKLSTEAQQMEKRSSQ
jgi:hypothetical protein